MVNECHPAMVRRRSRKKPQRCLGGPLLQERGRTEYTFRVSPLSNRFPPVRAAASAQGVSIAVPVTMYWTPSDLPVWTIFAGHYGEEHSLLRLSGRLRQPRRGFDRRPPLQARPRNAAYRACGKDQSPVTAAGSLRAQGSSPAGAPGARRCRVLRAAGSAGRMTAGHCLPGPAIAAAGAPSRNRGRPRSAWHC
jgi:hypothetical protein